MSLTFEAMTLDPQQFVRKRLVLAYALIIVGILVATAIFALFPDFLLNPFYFCIVPFVAAYPGKYYTHELKVWYARVEKNGLLARAFWGWMIIFVILIYGLPKILDDFGVLYGLVGWALLPFGVAVMLFAALDITYILGRPIIGARIVKAEQTKPIAEQPKERIGDVPSRWWTKYY